jgi:hypothetical protein
MFDTSPMLEAHSVVFKAPPPETRMSPEASKSLQLIKSVAQSPWCHADNACLEFLGVGSMTPTALETLRQNLESAPHAVIFPNKYEVFAIFTTLLCGGVFMHKNIHKNDLAAMFIASLCILSFIFKTMYISVAESGRVTRVDADGRATCNTYQLLYNFLPRRENQEDHDEVLREATHILRHLPIRLGVAVDDIFLLT